jgi:hypothetical protein
MGEAHIAHTFPSISSTGLGRFLGSIYGLPYPLGFLIHLMTVPLPVLTAIAMYFTTGFRRFQLTSKRVRIRSGLKDREGPQADLAELEEVRVRQRAGQQFYRAADLELVSQGKVILTLPGVPNAETFRRNILEASSALIQVRHCMKAQA